MNPLSIIDFSNIRINDMEIRDLNIHFLIIIGKYLNVVLGKSSAVTTRWGGEKIRMEKLIEGKFSYKV